MTRREMLQAAAISPLVAKSNSSAQTAKKKAIVAGGGIAGLSCAYELNRSGHDVTVLEASERVGGHVKTVRNDLPDGLYVDAGAEQFTKPGYDLYWSYVREFDLPYIQDHRRDHMFRCIGDKMYSEEQLADPKILSGFGLNQREIDYLRRHAWWELPHVYVDKYTDAFQNEYKPFDAGLNELDTITMSDLLKRDGASDACIRLIGGRGSALHSVWHTAILKLRGVPLWPVDVFRLKGGNALLPETFAKKLGGRVKLNCPVTAINHSNSGVTVEYRESGERKKMSADHLVCCMSAVMLRQIPITPPFSDSKHWAIANVPYYSATRPVFLAENKFWRDQNVGINMEFSQAALEHTWSMADDVESAHGLITGTSQPGMTGEKALQAFRALYPGKKDTITKTSVIDWSRDRWCMACETTSYRPGQLKRFWPEIIQPSGRIHFAGAYCDNLNWGQEAATRSGHRVAKEINEA